MAKKATQPKAKPIPPEILDELLRVGGMMSNICYNLAQPSKQVDEGTRSSMDSCRRLWDMATNKLRDHQKAK